jgi:Family of unknown function (DUF6768)
MTHTEDKLVEALKRLDLESGDDVETLSGVVADMVRNQSRYLVALPWMFTFVFLGVAVYSAVQFFASQEPKEWVLYATLFLTAMIIVAIFKLWFYLVWLRNSILREIKRCELRLLVSRSAKAE